MLKNTAGQKWRVFAFNRTNNLPVTGDAANITAKISGDYGSAVSLTDVNPTETEDGYYLFDLTQAETNYNDISIYPESSTSNVQVIGVPGNHQPAEPDGFQVAYTINTVPGRVSLYVTTDLAGTIRAEGNSGTFRSNASGSLVVDLAPGTYYAWPSKAGYTFTSPVALNVGIAPNSVTITGTASASGYATSYAAYYGAVFPAESSVLSGVQYTDGVEDWVGSFGGGGNGRLSGSPVRSDGTLFELIIGDDYKATNQRSLVWTIPTSVSVAACSLAISQLVHATQSRTTMTITGSVVAGEDESSLVFEIDADNWTGLTDGEATYSIEMRDAAGNEITAIHSFTQARKVRLLRKYT